MKSRKRKKNVIIKPLFMASVLLVTTIPISAYADTNNTDEITPSEIVEYVNDIVDISEKKEEVIERTDEITINTDNETITVEKDEPELIKIESDEAGDFSIELPDDEIGEDVIVEDNTIISENDEYFVTTEVEKGFIRNSFVIESADAPEEYEISFNLPPGTHLRFAKDYDGKKDGSIEAYNKRGDVSIAIDLPYAYDSNHKKVETYYKLNRDTITQIVKHSSRTDLKYPIVADPSTQFGDWFSGYKWIKRGQYWSLCLYPKLLLRTSALTPFNAVANAAWTSVYNRHRHRMHWPNNYNADESMRKQFHCHFKFAFWKSSFNLEPKRPNVNYVKMLAKKCNP